ncbi:hypothetical protein NEFER03_0265 [Nematocida sp. LUAm3]|nr:hypothetical protein NEFER03_0265 [Nematocida sp. LUAm3]KAI5173718.1 hypothetical protein NEFER02_0234 [Nematocida sp. LUAm2]KAI5176940.1 hypothetical protein NEFER01_0265 [Nematocida sp. LUAm1]
MLSVFTLSLVYHNTIWSYFSFFLSILYICSTVAEAALYAIIWLMKRNRRRAMKKNPIIKRRFGSEIRLPSITVSTEARHLRTKQDFTINGVVYIRKGETVELLRTIGSYYSVRNSIGTEYIVPKSHFF